MKKRILIATLNDYIIYQPTILNLYDRLVVDFQVEILSFEPDYLSKVKDNTRNVRYLKVNVIVKELTQKFDFLMYKISKLIRIVKPSFQYQYLYYNKCLPHVLKTALKSIKADHIIAVDIPALAVCQLVYEKVHFLSLEIDTNDPFYRKIQAEKIESVFIQNTIRLEYLLPSFKGPVFYVQNSPPLRQLSLQAERKDFIWAGTLLDRFGVMDCLHFFASYPQYKIVLKGGADKNTLKRITAEFDELIKKGIVTINQHYLPGDQFLEFISGFRIGFCFYSWELIRSNFNYSTAPSGKLFMYMAAGVPVIACRIPGFDFVESNGAGVLIDDYKPETIYNAVQVIESNYKSYQEGCFNVAKKYDFSTNCKPYIDFLKSIE